MPAQLALHFLGPPQLYLNSEPVTTDRRKALALLAYLALAGKQTRDSLSALLWPDYDQSKAFTNLRHTLWEVQQALGEGWLLADRETIEFNPESDISLDVHQFEALLAQSRPEEDPSLRIPLLSDSVKLYRNHFLTGFSLKDAAGFNEWAFAKSEELRHQLATVLGLLSDDHCALGQADQAIPHARRLITLDPLNESSHRQLMQVYIQAGQHSAALRQYQACEQLLRQELGLDPQPETRELYKKIRKREIMPVPQIEKQKATATPSHNIPLQLSTFIGREKEQKAVAKLIGSHRLVSLIGTGGIGKTRLALKVGEQLLENFANGIWLAELASLNDPALVPQAVGTLFGIIERSENTLSKKLIHYLGPKTALLILDNCEHLLDACAQLAETLLKNCPNLKILATSREGLSLPGEALYRVPSLSLPKGKQAPDQFADFESIRLFTDRARLSTNDFALTAENAATIAQICRRLDGIPLAIELAAARVNILSVEQIAARLNESFSFLTSSGRSKLARQQTLQASIEWSWDLLSDSERVLLRRLSVFAGGWTLDAAESVCSGDGIGSQQVLDLMTQLVMKSLVVADQESGRERRYHLLEMLRQYAHQKLAKSGEVESIAERHLNYFLQLSEKIEDGVFGPQQAEWFARGNEERDNLRAALTTASKNNMEAGLYLSSRLYRLWESINIQEGTHWLASFIQKPESRNYPPARAKALCAYAWLMLWRQQFSQAQSFAQEALELSRACKDKRGEIDALLLIGNTTEFQGNMASAIEVYQQILSLSQSLGYPRGEALAHFYLGWDRRNMARSFDHLEKGMILFRELGDWSALANIVGVLGTFHVLNGNVSLAQKYLDEATELWQFNKRVDIWENVKVAKSRLALLQGDYEQAGTLLQEILFAAQESGNRMSYLWNRAHLGQVALRTGNVAESHQMFADTARDFQKDGHTIGVVFGLEGIATVLIATGKPEKAARLIGCADATREQIPDVRPLIEEADMYRNMAAILSRIGPSGFEVAYDEGRSMTLDEAVAYALEENTLLSSSLRPERETNRAER